MATINGAVATNNVAWVAWSQTACNVDLTGINPATDPSGVPYIQIYRMALNLSGKDASRTVALGVWTTGNSLIGKTANFTETAASSASSTGLKTLTTVPLINRSTTSTVRMGFWVSGMGSVYYSADETSQSGINVLSDHSSSTSISTFNNDATLKSNASLVGSFDYYSLPTAPLSISAVAGTSSATVSWTGPVSDGGTSVTSYTLQRATNAGFTTGLTTTPGLTGTSTVVTGLANGTYYFRIAAVNAVATAASTTSAYSTATGPITVTSSATAPGQPTAFVVAQQSPQNPNGLALSWTAPSANGSAITAYVIKRSLSPTMSSPVTIITPTTGVTYADNSVVSGTTYFYTVAARNAIGDGAASAIATATTYQVAGTSLGIIRRWDSATSQWLVVV